jgi:fatty-acyl-CoA synthase
VVVFGVENASKGEEIFAAVEFKASRQTQLQKELKSFCRQRLLEYKIPRQIFCFPSFPKLANGKINRNEIKQSVLNMLQQSGVSHKTKNANVYLYQD